FPQCVLRSRCLLAQSGIHLNRETNAPGIRARHYLAEQLVSRAAGNVSPAPTSPWLPNWVYREVSPRIERTREARIRFVGKLPLCRSIFRPVHLGEWRA